MKTSKDGLNFVMNWEGTILKPYKDVAGIWTIGCGHVIKPGETFVTITRDEAMELLKKDIEIAERGVNRLVKVMLTQSMFDALCSFVFNAGEGALQSSTLLKKLNSGDYQGASQEFLKWCKITDPKIGTLVVNQGLVNRRKSEISLFLKDGIPTTVNSNDEDEIVIWSVETLKLAQTKLKSLGLYTINIDGLWGPKTESAIRTFSLQKGINCGQNPKAGVSKKLLNELGVN